MAISRINLAKQLAKSSTIGSILATNGDNELQYVAPPTSNVLWGYDHGELGTVYVNIGTNLSYDAVSNTLSASAGAGGYSDVLNDGSGFTNSNTNTKLNFVGSALQASDGGSGETDITIATILNTIATDGAVTLSTSVTGILPVGNGGTGANSLTGILQGNGASPVTAITDSSTVGQVLRVTGASTYGWGALDLADADAVTGILSITNGGTGSATQNFVDLSTNQNSIGGDKTFTGNTTFSNNVVINGSPSASNHAATKGYVDDLLHGLSWKDSVDVATTANITLSGEQTIDDVLTSSSRVLVKNQNTPAQNGIYVTAAGAWTRATDMNAWSEVPAAAVFVEAGTTQADTAWVCTSNDGGTLDTTDITFVKFSSASGVIDGSGTANRLTWWSDTDTVTAAASSYTDGSVFALGTTSAAASTILTTKGTGTGSSTYGILHQTSGGIQAFRVADDGTLQIGTGTDFLQITKGKISRTSEMQIAPSLATSSIHLFNDVAATNPVTEVVKIFTSARSYTSGNQIDLSIGSNYIPTSGTGTITAINIANSINQTGGASGITRGIHINPTLTAAADYRALEITTNASQYSIWSTAGKIRFDLGSDATGDLYTRASGGELARIAAGTSGYVLTSNGAGAAPTYQALPATGTTVTRAYIIGSTAGTFDLDANTGVVKDRNGNNVAFTIPTATDQFFVYLNGQLLQQGGTGNNRDYTVDTATHILTLSDSRTLVATDELVVVKFS